MQGPSRSDSAKSDRIAYEVLAERLDREHARGVQTRDMQRRDLLPGSETYLPWEHRHDREFFDEQGRPRFDREEIEALSPRGGRRGTRTLDLSNWPLSPVEWLLGLPKSADSPELRQKAAAARQSLEELHRYEIADRAFRAALDALERFAALRASVHRALREGSRDVRANFQPLQLERALGEVPDQPRQRELRGELLRRDEQHDLLRKARDTRGLSERGAVKVTGIKRTKLQGLRREVDRLYS